MGFVKNKFVVTIDGRDMTSILDPLLLELKVQRSAGQAADNLDMTLADPDGRVALPNKRSTVHVSVSGTTIFDGFVTDVTCDINKNEGRTIKLSASSVDEGSKAKQRSLRHKDNAKFAEVASEFGQKAGITVKTAGTIGDEQRDYWIQQNESFISWGQRMAREMGATFKVQGTKAIFVARNEGISASGKPLTSISAAWGTNLLSASIKVVTTKPKYSKVRVSYFDKEQGKRVDVDADVDGSDVDAILRQHLSTATESHARSRAEALKKESMRQSGQGSIEIVGNELAEPEANINVSGMRAGVDGTYRIHDISHRLTKRGGFVTSIQVRQPQDGAGKDKRLSSSKTSSSSSISGGANGPTVNAGDPSLTGDPNTNIG